jgi:flagellar M-ring protein FliF
MNSLLQQLRQLWSQLGINQRVTLSVTGVAVLAGMVALVAWSQRPQMQLLYGRLSPKDVSAVMASIQELGVKSELGGSGTSIYVSSDQVHKVRMSLASKGIPSGEGVGFEIFDRGNFGVSDFIQRTNYNRALQGELGRTISQLQGVRSARVLVVIPENKLLFTDVRTKPTASVFIEGSLTLDQVNSVRFLVASAVEGLKAEDVSIVDNRGQNLTESLREDPVLGAATSQMRLRKNVEDYFASKVETMLSKVLGPGKSVVRVSAELESEALTRSEEKFDPDGQVVRNETTTDDTQTTSETEPGQAPVGATANLNNPDAGGKNNTKTSDQQKKNKTTTFEINKVVLSSVKAPGSVSRLTAAVVVAPDPLNAQEKDPKKAEKKVEERKAMLRGMVANALGVKGTEDELKRVVSIEEMPFSESAPMEQGFMEMVSRNTDLLRDAGAVLVAVILFGAFVRMLRKTKPDEIPIEMLSAETETEAVGNLPSSGGGQSGGGFSAPQPITVDLINDMIRRKPENIGAALRNWIETDKANGAG